jgi:tmRNA-binding protein
LSLSLFLSVSNADLADSEEVKKLAPKKTRRRRELVFRKEEIKKVPQEVHAEMPVLSALTLTLSDGEVLICLLSSLSKHFISPHYYIFLS